MPDQRKKKPGLWDGVSANVKAAAMKTAEAFDPAAVRAERGNEIFARPAAGPKDYSTPLTAEQMSTSPQQIEAQRLLDLMWKNKHPVASPAPEEEKLRQMMPPPAYKPNPL